LTVWGNWTDELALKFVSPLYAAVSFGEPMAVKVKLQLPEPAERIPLHFSPEVAVTVTAPVGTWIPVPLTPPATVKVNVVVASSCVPVRAVP
jgi:hypothetical protein